MLIFLFLVPLALFFVRTFAEFDGTTAEFIEQARDLLLSQAYLTALGTTNWISLIACWCQRRPIRSRHRGSGVLLRKRKQSVGLKPGGGHFESHRLLSDQCLSDLLGIRHGRLPVHDPGHGVTKLRPV